MRRAKHVVKRPDSSDKCTVSRMQWPIEPVYLPSENLSSILSSAGHDGISSQDLEAVDKEVSLTDPKESTNVEDI